ncbi:hypothetical protein HPB49_019138 [Dermacentor silvarum]|uniref:Uncharacterized protein n=1 Tax=Dermacentor silvarum TaxID=543639 RepID=A0ACB8CGS0_DERSI|nr:sulfotransferase 1C2 [Dermacentor silvarum]KAH7941983.1 hypothetical protein HPB49_019138 [Dermacentor silvarum]
MDGHVTFGHYFEHILSWYAHRNDPNVFFFYYEHFKSDPRKTVLALAKFVDASIWQKLRTNKALLNDLLERISFAKLKSSVVIDAGESTGGADDRSTTPDDRAKNLQTSEEEMVSLGNFFRKGQVGDWKSYFKPEQEKRLREMYEKRMRGTEMWDVWKEYLDYND